MTAPTRAVGKLGLFEPWLHPRVPKTSQLKAVTARSFMRLLAQRVKVRGDIAGFAGAEPKPGHGVARHDDVRSLDPTNDVFRRVGQRARHVGTAREATERGADDSMGAG